MNKITKLITTILFVFSCVVAWALPGTTATNLQTTTGVTTSLNGNTLAITAPDKAVLTWQNFGSGGDAIGAGDTISYALPSSKASVLNVVAGNATTTIDGYLTSNGNVYVLNPNGVIINGSARIDASGAYFSTSDIPSFAAYYFQQNGKLPSQDKLAAVAGSTAINGSALINVTDNITIISKNVDIAGSLIQANLNVVADGNVNLGSSGYTVVSGNTVINNPTGITTLGTSNGAFTAIGNVAVTATTGAINNAANANFNAKALTVSTDTGSVNLTKVNSSNITATGANVAVTVGAAVNPVVSVTGNGVVAVTAPGALTANVANTNATASTSVVAAGALTLGTVHINSAGNTTFTGTSVTDSVNNNFVYGPVLFNATTGDVSITKSGNSFGPVSVATTGTATATVYEAAALNLGTINVSKLTAKTGDYVIQTGAVVTPSLTLTANKDITLGAANNIGAFNVTGANVLFNNNAAVALGNVNASGTLAVTSTGAITQAADTKVKAVGAVNLAGTSVNLANAGNGFGALTINAGTGNVTLAEDTTINIAGLVGNNVALTSLAGVITSGTAAINAGGTVTITAGADVTLGANFNSVGALTVSAANGNVDLGLLSFATNLRGVYPAVTAKSYKAPTP